MNRLKEAISGFSTFFPMAYLVAFYLRMGEAFLVEHRHDIDGIYRDVLTGFLLDVPVVTLLLVFLFPFYFLIFLRNPKPAGTFVLSILILFMVNHLFILQYFSYFLIPLNRFLKANTIREMIFSLSTSDIDAGQGFLWLILITGGVLLVLFLHRLLKPCRFTGRISLAGIIVSLIWISGSSVLVKNDAVSRITHNVLVNKSLFFYRIVLSAENRPKHQELTPEIISGVHESMPGLHFISESYPLLNTTDYHDVIGPFLSVDKRPPDIVLVIVEGLGTRFLEPSEGINLMPFLDSLVSRSLWWPNCLTSSERSFGAVPSLTGSLPHGERGFTFLEPLPAHFSLLTMLKHNGYQTSYFYGQGAWFHRKDLFLKENQVDRIVDNSSFDDQYARVLVGRKQNFWGFGDKELFAQSLRVIDTLVSGPKFNIWFTGSTHSPFYVPDPGSYDRKLDSLFAERVQKPGKRYINTYRKYLRTLIYSDEALRDFFRNYSQMSQYQNTIFIITGDHPMTEIPIHNWLKRYQVPMIIFSPMLKQSKTFKPVVSHYDLMPALMGFLSHNYSLEFPAETQAIGTVLDTASSFRNIQPVAMMNTDRNTLDYYWQDRFLADGKYLFRVDSLFNLYPVRDPDMLNDYRQRLDRFNRLARELCIENRLVPDSLYLTRMGYHWLRSDTTGQIAMKEENEFNDLMKTVYVNSAGDIFLTGTFYGVDTGNSHNSPSIIVYAGDSNGKTLLWEPVKVDFRRDDFVLRRKFTLDREFDGTIDIRVYLWNNQGGNITADKACLALFQQNGIPGQRQ
ncbi:MAG: LTA synthase family protein [Bacteroidota bacterium]